MGRIAQTGMEVAWWMCSVSLRDRKLSEEWQNRMVIASVADLDGSGMLREWTKKTQPITSGLLRLEDGEWMVDHVKHGSNLSMFIYWS